MSTSPTADRTRRPEAADPRPAMTFTEALRSSLLHRYATFAGRARRAEYWWFSLLYVAVTAAVLATAALLDQPALVVVLVAVVVPMLSVSVRRLHDTGRSGWWMLIALVPPVGPVLYLAVMAVAGDPGANRYGFRPA